MIRRSHALVISAALLAIGAGSFYALQQSRLDGQLIRAEPDAIADDADLRSFALAKAKPAYDRYCTGCHGSDMRGDPARGVPDLTDSDWLYGEGRIAEIEHTVMYGIRAGNPKGWNRADMPAFARTIPYERYAISPLEPAEISDLVDHLLMAGGKPADRDAAARGAKLFAGKGQCFDCHSPDGRGDNAIGAPNLIDGAPLYGTRTRDDLYAAIARGLAGFCPAWVGQLDPPTIRALAVQVHAASHPQVQEHPK